jgi:MOSC domain-containing protein YiiM
VKEKSATGDEMKLVARDPNAVSVSEITRLYIAKRFSATDVISLQKALRVAAFPESWKEYFRERITETSNLSEETDRTP